MKTRFKIDQIVALYALYVAYTWEIKLYLNQTFLWYTILIFLHTCISAFGFVHMINFIVSNIGFEKVWCKFWYGQYANAFIARLSHNMNWKQNDKSLVLWYFLTEVLMSSVYS